MNTENWVKRLKRHGRSRSVSGQFFRQKLFELLPGSVVPLLVLGISLGVMMRGNITSMTDEINRLQLMQTQVQIEQTIEEMDSLNITFSVNWDILRILIRAMLRENYSGTSIADVNKLTTNYLIPAVAARPYVNSLYIYLDNPYGRFLTDTNYLVTLDSFYDTDWMDSYEQLMKDNRSFVSELRAIKRYSFEQEPTEVITLFKRFFMHKGVVILNLSKSYFDAQLAEQVSSPSQRLLVVGEDGEVLMQSHETIPLARSEIAALCQSGDDALLSYNIGGENYHISRIHSDALGWTYLSITPLSALHAPTTRLLWGIFLGVLATAVFCAYFATRYARRSHQSLMAIIGMFESMEPNITPNFPDGRNDAYTVIMQNIVKNFANEAQLHRLLEQQRAEAKTLELTALRAQLNPHFLINTLQSIYWMSCSLSGGPNDVSRMIENMTGILSYSLEAEDELVPLLEEIKHTMAYITLQHMRYQRRFGVTWTVDEEANACYTLRLLLQPLVENAIVHGINWEDDAVLNIRIHVALKEETVSISVRDDGRGVSPEELEKIRLNIENAGEASHIGLANCHRRLWLTFGPAYGLTLFGGDGFSVEIRFPMVLDNV